MSSAKAKNHTRCEEDIKVHVGAVINIHDDSTITGNIQTTEIYHLNIKAGYRIFFTILS